MDEISEVLGTAALAVNQALGAVHDGADTAGDVQIALSAGIAGLLGQRHAVMAGIIQRIGRSDHILAGHISHSLDTQTAGNDHHMLGSLGNDCRQNLEGLGLVAQEISLGSAGNGLVQTFSQFQKCFAIRLICGFKLFETLVAGDDEQVILAFQQICQLAPVLQLILGIVFQLLTFLTNESINPASACRKSPRQAAFVYNSHYLVIVHYQYSTTESENLV